MIRAQTLFSTAFAVLSSLSLCLVSVEARRYAAHDPVAIVANTVGPFNNPTETYPYYHLPFCEKAGKQKRHKQNLGETLSGSRKVNTPYEVTFLDPVPWRTLCEEAMDIDDVSSLL
jgi:hypothetical protein